MKAPARRRRAVPKKEPDFYWFQGDSVIELVRRLVLAGPETARLEVYLENNKMTFMVWPDGAREGEAKLAPINDSRACPPICPG